jgi:2-oxoisovalerate dehydrogenase E2 component (dihydrolipoyl transacylase)
VPQFGYSDEVDMTELIHLCSLIRDRLLEEEIHFSYMPVIIKALSLALHRYPILNAVVNAKCTTVTKKADHNIGVVMNTAEGLVVPTVKQVQVR